MILKALKVSNTSFSPAIKTKIWFLNPFYEPKVLKTNVSE